MKTYREVAPAFGTWDDVTALARDYRLMADYMINHISAQSEYYQDFLTWHDNSPWKDLFIRCKDFWQGGAPTQAEVDAIYKRKPRAPSVTAHFADGTEEEVWCTFDEEQIDINCASDTARRFLRDNLSLLCEKGLRMIRLDAFAYATKKAGTSCFFIEPQVWELLDQVDAILKPYGATILPEIHEHYTMQLKLAERGYPVYDFALPMLLLNALYYGQSQYLRHWLESCPHSQYTTLDTHDYTREEVAGEVQRPVEQKLLAMMRFRNVHPAFDGAFILLPSDDRHLHIRRENGAQAAELTVDFVERTFAICATDEAGQMQHVQF